MSLPNHAKWAIRGVKRLEDRELTRQTGTVKTGSVTGSITSTTGLQVVVETEQGDVNATCPFTVADGAKVEVLTGQRQRGVVVGFAT